MATFKNKPSPGWLHISTAQKHVRSIGAETDRFVISIPNHTQSNPIKKNETKQKLNTIKHTCDINYNQKGMRILSFNKTKQT